jgi:hypothetical protein
MRDRIAALESSMEMDRALLKKLSGQLKDAKVQRAHWDNRICNILGNESSFLSSIPASTVSRLLREHQVFGPVSAYAFDDAAPVDFTVQRYFWSILSVMSEDDLNKFRRICTLVQRLPSGEQYFCRTEIDLGRIAMNTDHEQLARWVADQLVSYWKEQNK